MNKYGLNLNKPKKEEPKQAKIFIYILAGCIGFLILMLFLTNVPQQKEEAPVQTQGLIYMGDNTFDSLNKWGYLSDGEIQRGIFKDSSGVVRYANENGNLCLEEGVVKVVNGEIESLIYVDKDGIVRQGWIDDLYYASEDYNLKTGFTEIDGKKYFFDETGKKKVGWINDTYHTDDTGVIQTGWVRIDTADYFFNQNGEKLTGWKKFTKAENEKDHFSYFDESGKLAKNTKIKKGDKEYTIDGRGWVTSDTKGL